MKLFQVYRTLVWCLFLHVCTSRVAAEEQEKENGPQIQIRIFGNDSFREEYKFPVTFKPQTKLYVELRDSNNSGLVLLPSEVHVTPYRDETHHHTLGYKLIKDYCPVDITTDYLEADQRATRFKFSIRQYFGVAEQYLFVHCMITTCQRAEPPGLTVFNCATQAEYCPHRRQDFLSIGPIVVLPIGYETHRHRGTVPIPNFQEVDGRKGPNSAANDHKNCHSDVSIVLTAVGFFIFGMTVTSVMLLLNCKNKESKGDETSARGNIAERGDVKKICLSSFYAVKG